MADFEGNPFADPDGINPFAVSGNCNCQTDVQCGVSASMGYFIRIGTHLSRRTSNCIQGDCSQFNCVLGVKPRNKCVLGGRKSLLIVSRESKKPFSIVWRKGYHANFAVQGRSNIWSSDWDVGLYNRKAQFRPDSTMPVD